MKESSAGVSMVETMIAVLIALVVMAMLGGVVFTATVQNKNQGVEMSRVTVYAQDKIEALGNLDWGACVGATPDVSCNTTGITGSGWNTGLNAGGTLSQLAACPTSGSYIGYVDYLDANGSQYTGTSCSAVGTYAYQRQWKITDLISSGANTPGLKRIDVIVWSKNAVNTGSAAPSAMLTTYVTE